MINPILTIGICARNCEKTINLAIRSVLFQDFPHRNMEIILVDDGSCDNTLGVAENAISNTDIESRIISLSWGGVGKARNFVLSNARGEYILWVDSDEILRQDFVRKQMSLITKHPNVGILTGQIGVSSSENLVLTLELIPSIVEYSRQTWTRLEKLPGTGGSIYKVKAARDVGGFNERLAGRGEDIEIASRIKAAGWSAMGGDGVFFETHGRLSSWRVLWKRYSHEGAEIRRCYSKMRGLYSIYRINPIASLLISFFYAFEGYRRTKLKSSLILPVHFFFKMTAWFYGFSKR
jgi:glycosyltransferase involved in cell wall biosynthesis